MKLEERKVVALESIAKSLEVIVESFIAEDDDDFDFTDFISDEDIAEILDGVLKEMIAKKSKNSKKHIVEIL